MRLEQFKEISHLEGLEFIKALLRAEEQRFEQSQFLKGSTFEEINADFGIFPTMAAYPVYFVGDIRRSENKTIFTGINPGYNEARNRKEQDFLQSRGLFEGYCRLYGDYRFDERKVPYYSKIAQFLQRLFGIAENIDWDWFQEHFIAIELIPYHSEGVSGLRINDKKKFRDVHFAIILKLLGYLNPQKPIFINGFPTYRNFMTTANGDLLPEFQDAIEFSKFTTIWTGKIGKRYDFIGLPFLARPKEGMDAIVAEIKRECGQSVSCL